MTHAPAWPEWADNSLSCWELAVTCLRAEVLAGRKLTPDEMLSFLETEKGAKTMPIYKVTMTETDVKTITAYVEASDQEAADAWACMVDDGESVGIVTSMSSDEGTVEDIEKVDAVGTGYALNVAS